MPNIYSIAKMATKPLYGHTKEITLAVLKLNYRTIPDIIKGTPDKKTAG